MKYIINDHIVLSQEPEGPLKEYISSFSAIINAQGYALSSTHQQVYLVTCFSRWLKENGIELQNITSNHPSQYLQYRAQNLKPRAGDFTALCRLIDFLRSEGVIPEKKMEVLPLTPIEQCVLEYEHYLRNTRNLA